jgi:hypothetical protein
MAEWQNGRMAECEYGCHAAIALGPLTNSGYRGTRDAGGVGMNFKAEELKARTKQFALDVIRFVSGLPRIPAADVMGRQLLKAGTSVAANSVRLRDT